MSGTAKILVTGAGGFVGRHLVASLLQSGESVAALTRPSSQLPDEWKDRVERIDCSDWTLAGFERALEGCDVRSVFHLASYGVRPTDRDPALMRQINVGAAADLVRLCGRLGATLVMAGSSAEYGEPAAAVPLDEESPPETAKLYGSTKAEGGRRARQLAQEVGMPFRLLRLFNVYGPGEARHRLLPSLAENIAAGRPVPLSAGTQVRDFIYVGDVVEALRAAERHAAARSAPSATWNVCTGKGTSVREFAQTVAALLGGEGLLRFGELPMRADDVPWLVGDCRRINAELGWSARHDLAAGLRASLSRMKAGLLERGGTL